MQEETEQLLTKFTRFLGFLSSNGPTVTQGTTSSIALQMPQIALAKFNLLMKEICHKSPAILDEIHKYANNFQLFQSSTTKQQLLNFIINIVCSFGSFSSKVADIKIYIASFNTWASDVTNQENVHKLFCYLAMFDELVDHSKCCGFVHTVEQKIEKAEEKIDEIGLKIIEVVTKPKQGVRGKKAATKKT